MYNKQELKKVNNKKVMRKVKKQWIIVSAAMFSFLGVYGVTNITKSGETAHADVVRTYNPANSAAAQSVTHSDDSSVVNTSYQTVTQNDPSSYASNASSAASAVAQISGNATKITDNINSLYNNNRDKSNFVSASAVASSATVKLASVNADAQSQSTIASSNYQEVNNHLAAIESLTTVDSAQAASAKDIKNNPSAAIDAAKQAQINGSLISDHATSIGSLTTVISVAASNAENDQSVASQAYVELSSTDASLNGSSVAVQSSSSSSALNESSESTSTQSSASVSSVSSDAQSVASSSATSSLSSDVQSSSSIEVQSSSDDSSINSSNFNGFSDLFSGFDSAFTFIGSMNNDANQNSEVDGSNVFDSSNFEKTINDDISNVSNMNNNYSVFTFPTNAFENLNWSFSN